MQMEEFWNGLPREIQTHCLSFLPIPSLYRCFLVSNDWYHLARDNTIWRARFVADYGEVVSPNFSAAVLYGSWMECYRDHSVAPAWDPTATDPQFFLTVRNRKVECDTSLIGKPTPPSVSSALSFWKKRSHQPSSTTIDSDLWPRAIALHSISPTRSRVLKFLLSGRRIELGLFSAPSKEHLFNILHTYQRDNKTLHALLKEEGTLEGDATLLSLHTRKVYVKKNKKLTVHKYEAKYESSGTTLALYINAGKQTAMWELGTGVGCATHLPSPGPLFLVYTANLSSVTHVKFSPSILSMKGS